MKKAIGMLAVGMLMVPHVYAQEASEGMSQTSEVRETPVAAAPTTTEPFSEMDLFALPYGIAGSAIDIHVYLSIQYWNYEYQALGKYANQGHASTGHSDIIPYSGYIDLSSKIHKDMKVEAEFELYKGNKLKVCRLRGVWQPVKMFRLSLGRDFGLVGMQEELYYPTSKYKLFTIPPFLHWSVIRYTGWWDNGAFGHCEVPMTLFSSSGKMMLDVSVTDGPGISSTSAITPNADGYMYENFHSLARQAHDGNHDKPVAVRYSVVPWTDFIVGGSYLNAKWDPKDQHFAQYIFGHLLLDWEGITVVGEYGQIKFGTPNNGIVTQFSGYIAAGYTLLQNMDYIKFLQPVVRYEHYDSWKEDPSRKGYRQSVSAGLRYSPFSGWIIKAAYQITTETQGPELANDGFAGEVIFEF